MEQEPGLITTVICTRNRPDLLARAVRSILDNTDPHFELVVIDQSDGEGSYGALGDMKSDARLRFFHTDRVGLSSAYNAAVSRGCGELFAFTDDDCVAPADWLTSVRKEFEMDPEADLVYGQVLAPQELQLEPGVIPTLHFPIRRRLGKQEGFVVAGMGANFAARRRAFEVTGGFDEVLGGGGALRSSQDFDFQFRLFRLSRISVLSPDVKVLHYGHRTRQQWPQTMEAYGIGDGGFYMKHLRCGDMLAARLLAKRFAIELARSILEPIAKHRVHSTEYLRGLFKGSRQSFRFGIDRERRLYVAR